MSKLIGRWVANNTLDENHIKTSVAGNGITGGNGSALAVQADGSTLGVSGSGVKVAAAGITATELNASVAGNGITGGGGSALAVSPDSTGGANLSTCVSVTSNGVAVKVDDTSIEDNGSDQLSIKDGGVGVNELAAAVAGGGLTGGGGSALAVNVDDSSLEIATDTLQVKSGGVTNDMLAGSIALSKLAEAVIEADGGQAFTADQSMGSNKLTSLSNGTDANDAVNKSQLDAAVSGISWKEPAQVGNLIGNATIATIDGLTPAAGDSYVATDAGTPTAGTSDALAAGDVAEFDGTSWKKIVSNSGGYVPSGTRAILSTTTALISPYTDATDDGKIVDFSGSSNTGSDTSDAVEGNAVLVVDPNNVSVYDDLGYVFEGTVPSGAWVQFTGAGQINAGDGLTKSGNTLNVGQGNGVNVTADAIAVAADSTGGANLATVVDVNSNGVAVKIDDSTISENGSNQLYVPSAGITETQLNSSVAGDGLTGAGGSALSIDIDGSTLSVSASGLKVAAAGITGTELNTSVAGNGLTGGGGSALAVGSGNGINVTADAIAVLADSTGGANLATVVDVNSNGVAIKIDDDTIGENGSNQLYVKANGIGAAELDETDTYDFTGGVVDVVTQSQGDGSTKAASTSYVDTAVAGMSTENIKQEMHKITSGEVTAGYFTLANSPVNAQSVRVTVVNGIHQVSKQVVGSTGVTPDFDVLNTSQVHINNNGSATGLSGDMGEDDVVIIEYEA